uniref:Uncharacterized protein n=1 Tax=Fagus sylvatica TaxID=28930 RepID=A0A2N9H983_FAGSY
MSGGHEQTGYRSNSTISTRSGSSSLATLSDIVHEEDEVLPHSDLDLQNWSLPKINKKEVYDQSSWVSSVFQTEHKVKTVERAYALNKNKEECLLFCKKEMKEFKNKGFRFIHIGLIQVGIKPLTRRGINASVLLRLIDARFTNENQARLGMVEANVGYGPIWFNVNPDLTLSLDDGAPEKALTLRINTSGYHMIEGSRPLALVYRIYYKLFKTNLNPQALIKDPQDQTLLLQASREDINVSVPKMIKWEDIKLPDEWDLPNEMPPTVQTPINIAEQDNLESVLQYHDVEESLFEHFGAQGRIFFSNWRSGVPWSIRDDFCLGAMDGPPFEEPKWWLALRFSKLELRIELDEPGMGHIRKLNE